jgi:hypothetical protein
MATEIDYSAVLADLEEKRAAIDSAIAGVRQMLNLGAEQGVGGGASTTNERGAQPPSVRFDSFFRMSMPAAIIKLAGETVNVEGKWGLASWYPAARRAELNAKPKQGRKRGRPKGSGKIKAAKATEAKADKAAAPKPTAEQIERIRKLDDAGKKPGEIAKEVGLHHFSVMGVLKSKKAA